MIKPCESIQGTLRMISSLVALWVGLRSRLKPHDPEYCGYCELHLPHDNGDCSNILNRIKSSFARAEQVRGVYVNPTPEGCDVVITYPESMRLGEALKTLVPIEVELARKCKDTPIEFEYLPVTDIPDEVRSSYKILLEHKGQESGAE